MESSRLTQFGQLLGLSPGMDGPGAKLPSMKKTNAVSILLMELTPAEYRTFWCQVAAEYLPSMIRTFKVAAFNLEDTWHRNLYTLSIDWLVSARQTLVGHRFIRENSDVIIAYHLEFLNNLAKLPHSFIRDDPDRIRFLRMLLLTLNNSKNGLMANHLGPYIPVPIPTLAEQSAITRLVHVVSTSRHHYVDADTLDDWSETLLQTMRLGTVDFHFARVDAPRMILDQWWVCEWARVEGRRTGGDVACVDEDKVEDMRACSKCVAARKAPTTSLEAAQGRVLQIELVDGWELSAAMEAA
ncbi:hypothetical protein BDY24DRAFT_393302 [Mrakia frigida]|uniref:uncharacterized protein n=1 Tax=Mrakia frigida TaxID=29902 RepID=UPI003FCC1FE7